MTDEIQKPVFKAPPRPLEMPRMVSPQVQQTMAPQPQPMAVERTVTPPMSTPPQQEKAPMLQQNRIEGIPQQKQEQPAQPNPYANNFAADLNLSPKVLETKVMGSILAGLFFFGMMMGCVMFGGETTQRVQGLDGIVSNPDVQNKGNLRRCGTIDPNKECVLFVMNAKTHDRLGSDFYQEAQNVTGVPKYSIQLANVQYANALIRPGYIAQIYIPARR